MKRRLFEERVKAIPADMNGLSEVAEEGIGELIRSISGGLQDILFENKPPSIVHHPAIDIQITVPDQFFAVSGVPGSVAAVPLITRPDVPDWHKIWLVVGRLTLTDSRDRLIIAGPTLSVMSQVVDVEDEPVSRVEVTSSGNPAVDPGPPVMGPSDVGYVLLASIKWNGAIWEVLHNTPALYTFPGLATPGLHGPTHLPAGEGGTDPVPLATATGSGLATKEVFSAAMGALQNLFISGASPHLTKVITGNNITAQKQVELRLRSTGSFTDVLESGEHYLGLNFLAPAAPYGGTSLRPARSDHTHPPEDNPIAVLSYHLTLPGLAAPYNAPLGKLLPEIEFFGVSRIYQVQVFWNRPAASPPGPEWPGVPCDWTMIGPNQFAGINAVIVGSRKVRLQVANSAFLFMHDEALNYIKTIAPGGVTWTYFGDPRYPTQGELFVRILGIR